MTLPTGVGAIIALIVLVTVVVLLILHEIPLLLGALIGGLALSRLI